MEERTTLNYCPAGGCHAGCIHRTSVQDGHLTKVARLVYPDGEEGVICVKGAGGIRLPYHEERLKYPMKRAGERGEGKWSRISWEQALDEIAEKIREIREKYQPESVAIHPFGNSVSPPGGIQSCLLGDRLRILLRATNIIQGWPIDSNPFLAGYFNFGTSWAQFIDPRTLIKGNTKFMIVWGCNPAEMSVKCMKDMKEAQKKGSKLVDIGLIFDETAKESDWWT